MRQHRQRRATFSKCVKAWQRRDRGRAFRTWVTTTLFLRNLGRCVSRMCHRQLSSAFTKWSGRSFALSKRRSLHEDSVKRLARNLQRWLRWRRNRAFLKWTAIIGAANLSHRVLIGARVGERSPAGQGGQRERLEGIVGPRRGSEGFAAARAAGRVPRARALSSGFGVDVDAHLRDINSV